jgi:hypothetical protein
MPVAGMSIRLRIGGANGPSIHAAWVPYLVTLPT